jgi:tripartite-type tricarboxylate transporter receptor subunit TctC
MRLATFRRIVLAAAWFALSCGGAAAQDPAAFFKGRTLRMIVGFGPGGGYDLYARLVAKYLGAHI